MVDREVFRMTQRAKDYLFDELNIFNRCIKSKYEDRDWQ